MTFEGSKLKPFWGSTTLPKGDCWSDLSTYGPSKTLICTDFWVAILGIGINYVNLSPMETVFLASSIKGGGGMTKNSLRVFAGEDSKNLNFLIIAALGDSYIILNIKF